jgi:hypothetical protein
MKERKPLNSSKGTHTSHHLQTGFCLAKLCNWWKTAGAGGSGRSALFPLLAPYKKKYKFIYIKSTVATLRSPTRSGYYCQYYN